jgi:teichoic acid transport system ATP-binding protein
MNDIVINVKNLKKTYKLYDNPMDRMKESLSITHKNYHKQYNALNDISFNIRRGQTVGIIGTNGSGKSTLLKILTGVLSKSSGNVEVNGRISALLELGAGFNMEYTGIENVYLNGTMMGYSKEEMNDRLENIIDFADIGDFINQPVKTYSSGMFARLAFAVAINIDPDILIVDEALSVGDIFFQAKCYRKFEEFKKKGKTILFVTHDMSSIIKYCDETILLNKGQFIAKGKSVEMVDIYKKILVNQYNPETDKDVISVDSNELGSIVWKDKMQYNPNKIIYGNKKAEIIDFALIDNKEKINNSIEKFTEFSVKMKIKFNETVENPIYAFTIKDLKGTDITGTNTMIEEVDTGTKRSGEVVTVTFTQEMNLQGGSYLLSLGCTGFERDNFTVYNRLYDICNINVISIKNSVGFYDTKSKVVVE